jgi:DNA-binding MarR family transcriptional regulator
LDDMTEPRDAAAVDPEHLDVVLAALFAGLALNERVTERLHAAGFADVRFSHGFVFQHLVPGPLPVGELARRMDVSQQAASKAAAELEALGYVERVADPDDARVRRLALSDRGRAAVAAGRAARAEVAEELAGALGPRRVATLRRALLDALAAAGGLDAVRARRVPPVR